MNGKKEVEFIYLLIYHRIKKKAEGKNFITHSAVMDVLKNNLYHIKTTGHYIIIKEMEKKYNLLRRIDKDRIEITGGNIDLKLSQYNYPLW